MKAVLVWPICWTLYWIGNGTWHLLHRFDDDSEPPGWAFNARFRFYQSAMGWSYRIQIWAEGGRESRILPWRTPDFQDSK